MSFLVQYKKTSMKNYSKLVSGKVYVLLDGTSSVYDDRGTSVGYFQGFGHSFVRIDELGEEPTVTMFGKQFKVTSDGGIGNSPSTWAEWDSSASGKAILKNMRLAEVTDVLKELKKWNKKY